jgi:hypothetical protein
MEQQLLDIFPDENVPVRNFTSFINQPERIQISSQEDISDYDQNTLTTYFNFRVPLPRPALNVKSVQLARANIPNAVASFPNTECTFWYYAIPNSSAGFIYDYNPLNPAVPGDAVRSFTISGDVFNPPGTVRFVNDRIFFDGSGQVARADISGLVLLAGIQYTYDMGEAQSEVPTKMYAPNGDFDFWIEYTDTVQGQLFKPNYLRYFRLLPDTVPPELFLDEDNDQLYGFNRIFDDADDLAEELTFSTLNDIQLNQDDNGIPGEFKFVQGMVTCEYNSTFKKFVLRINPVVQDLFAIMPCASDDPNWYAAAQELAERDDNISGLIGDFGVESAIQPFVEYRNLNLRLGFNWAAYPVRLSDLQNMIRPHPSLYGQALTSGRDYTSFDLSAPGYADLVNTACIHIYTDITGGSTVDSIVNKALLGSVPMNTTALGVGFHSLPLNNPLTKIPTQINEIYIEMRNDTGQPFLIGNNAVVSLELILTY